MASKNSHIELFKGSEKHMSKITKHPRKLDIIHENSRNNRK